MTDQLKKARSLSQDKILQLQRETSSDLIQTVTNIQLLAHCACDLTQVRATLIINYVTKSTDGIQIQLTNEMSTHELMMQVLQQYSQQLKQSTPVKDAK